MINEHVSEQDIQLSVLDNALLTAGAKHHLQHCTTCKAKVQEYELLFAGVAVLPKPSFDFDVAELVMPLLPEKKKTRFNVPVIIAAVLFSAGLISLPFFLFDRRVDTLWKSVSPWMLGLAGIVGIVFVVMNIADMYSRYRHQLQKMNFE